MVVFCEKCNSKFQVDDAKIPETGIKARCSVCSHAFILRKEPTQAATAPAVAVEKPQEKPTSAAAAVTQAAPVKDSVSAPEPIANERTPVQSFFSGNRGELSPKPAADNQFVVEITDHEDQDDVHEIYESEDNGSADLAEAFSAEPAPAAKQPFGYEAFASFVERQKQGGEKGGVTEDGGAGPANAGRSGSGAASEPIVQKAEPAVAQPRVPEVLPSNGAQLPSSQLASKSEREIVTLLDERGMTDDYVVQMVQEICNAVKYVEGVEKPDWPTRMMGLDMLCKIKGLYAGEKKEDPANRQLQIVAGINM